MEPCRFNRESVAPPAPTRFPLPPGSSVLADCRWNCERRMGLGDKIVTIGALQALRKAGFRVSALCNPADLWMFRAAGLLPDWGASFDALLPVRDHCMAIPPGATQEDAEAADLAAKNPVARVLWGWGLEEYAPDAPAVHLDIAPAAPLDFAIGCAVWFPVEVSRRRFPVSLDAWEKALRRVLRVKDTILALSSTAERDAANAIIAALPQDIQCRVFPQLPPNPAAAASLVAAAGLVVTGNSGGMWMALSTGTPCLVCQRPPDNPHAAMWQAREWPGLRLRLLDA